MELATDFGEPIILHHHFEQLSCQAIPVPLENSIFLTAVSAVVATVDREQPFSLDREYLSLLKHYTSYSFNSVLVNTFLIFPSPIKS